MIIEAICVVAGAVPPTIAAIELWRQREQWHKNADEALALSRKALAQRDFGEAELGRMRQRLDATHIRNRTLSAENADLRTKLEALQSKPCALPKRDAAGRFVAREVVA